MASLVAKLQSIETSEYKPSFSTVTAPTAPESNQVLSEGNGATAEFKVTPELDTEIFDDLEGSIPDNISAVSESVSESGFSTSSLIFDYTPLTRRQEIALEREARLKAEQDNLRFHPQLIARRSSTNYTEGEIRTSRFEILYNEARQRQLNDKSKVVEKSSFTPKITQRAKSRERSESPEDRINRLHSSYGAGRRNDELENTLSDQCTYRPKITKRAKSLDRNNDTIPHNERLYQRAQAIEEKHKQLKASSEKRLIEGCTFSPRINSRRSPLREQEYRSPIEISDRMQRYLQERERRLQESQRLKEEQDAINAPFRPQLSTRRKSSGNRSDVDLVDVFTRLACADRDRDIKLATKQLELEPSFKPQIVTRRRPLTPTPVSNSLPSDLDSSSSVSSTVYERLYEKGEQRRKELEINRQLQRQSDESSLTFTPQLRTPTTPTRSRKTSPETVASEREVVMERLTSGKQYVQDILSQLKTQYELRDCTFSPEINAVSRQKAESNPRFSAPIHERLQAQAERTKEKVKQLEHELRKKEMDKCTFAPILPKSPVVVETNGRDVFERMYQDEKEWEARIKRNREASRGGGSTADCTFHPKVPHTIKVESGNDVFDRLSAKSPLRGSNLSRSNSNKRLSINSLQSETMSAVSGLSERSGSVSSRNSFGGSVGGSHGGSFGPPRTSTPSKYSEKLPCRRTSTPVQRRSSTPSASSSVASDDTRNSRGMTSRGRLESTSTIRSSTPSRFVPAPTSTPRACTPTKTSGTPVSTARGKPGPSATPVSSQKNPRNVGVTPKGRSVATVVGPASDKSEARGKSKGYYGNGSLSLLDAVHDASELGQLSPLEPSISSVKSQDMGYGALTSAGTMSVVQGDVVDTPIADQDFGIIARAVDEQELLLNLDDIPHATSAVALRKEVNLLDDPSEPTIVSSSFSP